MATSTKAQRWSGTVADVMHRDVVSVRPDVSVQDLARLLRDRGVTGVPVVDDRGTAVGMVSVTDLLWLADHLWTGEPVVARGRRGGPLEARTVREVMTPDAFGVAPTASLDELVGFFSRTGLHRALVMEERRVVGIVSATDLLGLLVGGDEPVGHEARLS